MAVEGHPETLELRRGSPAGLRSSVRGLSPASFLLFITSWLLPVRGSYQAANLMKEFYWRVQGAGGMNPGVAAPGKGQGLYRIF